MDRISYKKKFVNIEYCTECAFPHRQCFSVNLGKGEYSLCTRVKLREMLKEWTCEQCGIKLGIEDIRHRIPVTPPEEMEKLEKTRRGETVYLKPYVKTKVVCDKCFNKLPGTTKALELFGFERLE